MTRSPQHTQMSLDEVGQPLDEVTFVVVDLETTGRSRERDGITEIAAVKTRGGETVAEFSTLVSPGRRVPSEVTAITGITDHMLSEAPALDSALTAFLDFVGDGVIVAHNAPFDLGFLRAGCARLGLRWPTPPVVCTLRLARRVLSAGRTRGHSLGELTTALGTAHAPAHRALRDARATADVLHALLRRLPHEVRCLEELSEYLSGVTAAQRGKRDLAAGLPAGPGVYMFLGPNEEVLYIGTATNLRRRVGQYFTAGERRARVREMVSLAERVDHVSCAHPLEAQVRELRLLGAHRPEYNSRSKNPGRAWWISLTAETFPRLRITRKPGRESLGPFRTRNSATRAVEALHEVTGIRSCTERIPAGGSGRSPCAVYELGRCGAPCAGHETPSEYDRHVGAVRELGDGSGDVVLHRLHERLEELATLQRFEEAACGRDRLAALVHALDRGQRLAALASVPELVAARPDGSGGWMIAVVRHGRLAAAGTAPRDTPPMPVVEALLATAETVVPGPDPLYGAPVEEVRVIHRWLSAPETRMVRCRRAWSEPAGSAGKWREWAERASSARTPYAGAD
ncbi:DEDD exonuclease domain-containing protein [Actinopolyspora mortivallis]|uniref:DEDD exnuclease domain-containing protein n=1 Tax=Actinopolyspora mortivallis TaxID=33906 RepID=A0A2T0H0U7_ACTMO|nr:DEDD exonuclease domain-containing protein [Actinopolyspora mortivallis]PRW64999.1 DEDD exnuclease domain-containing protein [Actinopolyspora mortivallis]